MISEDVPRVQAPERASPRSLIYCGTPDRIVHIVQISYLGYVPRRCRDFVSVQLKPFSSDLGPLVSFETPRERCEIRYLLPQHGHQTEMKLTAPKTISCHLEQWYSLYIYAHKQLHLRYGTGIVHTNTLPTFRDRVSTHQPAFLFRSVSHPSSAGASTAGFSIIESRIPDRAEVPRSTTVGSVCSGPLST